ncbi:hypothetical protein T439DRAFT_337795 [Meredithblackwellia eburnea MCA 4105]
MKPETTHSHSSSTCNPFHPEAPPPCLPTRSPDNGGPVETVEAIAKWRIDHWDPDNYTLSDEFYSKNIGSKAIIKGTKKTVQQELTSERLLWHSLHELKKGAFVIDESFEGEAEKRFEVVAVDHKEGFILLLPTEAEESTKAGFHCLAMLTKIHMETVTKLLNLPVSNPHREDFHRKFHALLNWAACPYEKKMVEVLRLPEPAPYEMGCHVGYGFSKTGVHWHLIANTDKDKKHKANYNLLFTPTEVLEWSNNSILQAYEGNETKLAQYHRWINYEGDKSQRPKYHEMGAKALQAHQMVLTMRGWTFFLTWDQFDWLVREGKKLITRPKGFWEERIGEDTYAPTAEMGVWYVEAEA